MTEPRIFDLPCLCATLRRASRALTQLYEADLRAVGLRSSQFTLLQVLSRAGELPQGVLGQILAMDSTTLTRTLRIMKGRGWIAERRGKDRRERLLRLSVAGKNKLHTSLPAWEKTQARVRRRVGERAWLDLETLLNQLLVTTEIIEKEKV